MKPVYPLIVASMAFGYIVYKIYLGPKLRIAKAKRAYKEANRHKLEKINKRCFEMQ